MRLDSRRASQVSTGPLWSSEEESRGFLDRGWHARASSLILWGLLAAGFVYIIANMPPT